MVDPPASPGESTTVDDSSGDSSDSFLLQVHLHHSDAPSLKLSTTLLNSSNFSRWKRAVEVSLSAKNKLSFVQGHCSRPASDPKLIAKWDQCNSMLISWLLHSMEKEIGESVLFCNTATQIWSELAIRFGQSNRTSLYQIQKELSSIAQGNRSITSYFTAMKKLWDDYTLAITQHTCKCGSNAVALAMMNEQQVIQLLVGLNESFNLVRSHILMLHPSPSVNEVYKLLLQEESQRSLSNLSVIDNTASALYSHQRTTSSKQDSTYGSGSKNASPSNTNNRPYCDNCKVRGHTVERCWKIVGYPKSPVPGLPWCSHCRIAGHDTVKCWKVIGYPPGHKLAASAVTTSFTPDQMTSILALLDKQQSVDHHDPTALIAGPFDEECLGDWTST